MVKPQRSISCPSYGTGDSIKAAEICKEAAFSALRVDQPPVWFDLSLTDAVRRAASPSTLCTFCAAMLGDWIRLAEEEWKKAPSTL